MIRTRLSYRFGVVPLCFGLLTVPAAVPGLVGCGGSSGGSTGMGGTTGTGGMGGGAVACQGAVVTPTKDCPTTDVVAPSGTFTKEAACGEEGEATANACTYDGYEDLIILDNTSFETVCQIRFTVKRVGNAPAGCRYTNFDTGAQADCGWTQTVEYTNPVTMLDVNGACAASSFGLNSAKLQQLTGCRVAIGYAPECGDHDKACRMKYYVSSGKWDVAPGGLSYCTPENATAGNCSPSGRFGYNPRVSCDYQ